MEKIGLVLEGGGVKGAYQIGALRVLFDAGYNFDGIAGTSIGALNGAMLLQGSFDQLVSFWQNIKASEVMDVDDDEFTRLIDRNFDKQVWNYFKEKIKNISSLVDKSTEKMRAYVKSMLNEQKIRSNPADFGFVTYSLPDFEPYELFKEDVEEGKLVDYIIASANFPLYRLQEIDGKKFIDGGVWDNLPIGLLARKGYRNIVVVRTNIKKPKRKVEVDDLNLLVIQPSEKLGKAWAFTTERVEYYEKLGYFDALRVLRGYGGKRYYLQNASADDFAHYFQTLPTTLLCDMIGDFDRSEASNREEVSEKLLLRLQWELHLVNERASMAECFIAMLEKFAAYTDIERFKLYDFMEFVSCVCRLSNLEKLSDDDTNAYARKGVGTSRLVEMFVTFAKYVLSI